MAGTEREAAMEVRGIRRVLGPQARRAIGAALREGLGEAEFRSRFDRVMGVLGASLAAGRGEVVRVLGLSCPGKSALIRRNRHLIAPTGGIAHILGRNAPDAA